MFSRDIGLKAVTPPVSSPQRNGMVESFVKTRKRDDMSRMPKPDVTTALQNRDIAFDPYPESPPHGALKYRSPRAFRQQGNCKTEALLDVR
ncbi:integrase core domain-containing protein [Pandoraea sputorum]|uniref:Transposase n=1 Tax=Pandoraea sputorum TaxID=93222 RepID=A0A5E5BJ48_9BURK|nr:transposase [Pandoraea sputorum]